MDRDTDTAQGEGHVHGPTHASHPSSDTREMLSVRGRGVVGRESGCVEAPRRCELG